MRAVWAFQYSEPHGYFAVGWKTYRHGGWSPDELQVFVGFLTLRFSK